MISINLTILTVTLKTMNNFASLLNIYLSSHINIENATKQTPLHLFSEIQWIKFTLKNFKIQQKCIVTVPLKLNVGMRYS